MVRVVTSTYMIICLPSASMKNEFLLPKIKMNRKLITKYSREIGKVYVRSFYVGTTAEKINYLMPEFRQIYFRFIHDDISTINVAVEKVLIFYDFLRLFLNCSEEGGRDHHRHVCTRIW